MRSCSRCTAGETETTGDAEERAEDCTEDDAGEDPAAVASEALASAGRTAMGEAIDAAAPSTAANSRRAICLRRSIAQIVTPA